MSDTPRSDAEARANCYSQSCQISLEFARRLERENAEQAQALQAETVMLDAVAAERDKLKAENAALRELLVDLEGYHPDAIDKLLAPSLQTSISEKT